MNSFIILPAFLLLETLGALLFGSGYFVTNNINCAKRLFSLGLIISALLEAISLLSIPFFLIPHNLFVFPIGIGILYAATIALYILNAGQSKEHCGNVKGSTDLTIFRIKLTRVCWDFRHVQITAPNMSASAVDLLSLSEDFNDFTVIEEINGALLFDMSGSRLAKAIRKRGGTLQLGNQYKMELIAENIDCNALGYLTVWAGKMSRFKLSLV